MGFTASTASNGAILKGRLVTTDIEPITAPLISIAGSGCNNTDFPLSARGGIVLIPQGSCDIITKLYAAGAAGALGVLVYAEGDPGIGISYDDLARNDDQEYLPTLLLDRGVGTSLMEQIAEGASINVTLGHIAWEDLSSFNIIAQTKTGDQDNVLVVGSRLDSVENGPGINDDGSGSAATLEVAKQLSTYAINNAVRFIWFGGEEEKLCGSESYVHNLATDELAKMRLMLNFDMLASPNGGHFVYDSDRNQYDPKSKSWRVHGGPPGSAQVAAFFQDFYKARNITIAPILFNDCEDAASFLDYNIPVGGIPSGSKQLKTTREKDLWGGQAGLPYDSNYHQAEDTMDNVDVDAFEINAKAVAAAVARYAINWNGIPVHNASAPIVFHKQHNC